MEEAGLGERRPFRGGHERLEEKKKKKTKLFRKFTFLIPEHLTGTGTNLFPWQAFTLKAASAYMGNFYCEMRPSHQVVL